MVQAVDIRETTTSAATINGVFLEAKRKGMFTPARVFASTQRVFRGVTSRAVLNVHTAADGLATRLAAAINDKVKAPGVNRTAQAAIGFSRLPKLGKPGIVTSHTVVDLLDLKLQRVEFANGVRVLLNATTAESSRVYVRVRFGSGYAALPADRRTPIWPANLALMASGIGTLKQGDIDQMTAGRRMGLDFAIDDDAFALGAMTSPGDLADQLRLMATKIAVPGWDPNPVLRARTYMMSAIDSLNSSPDQVLGRDLEGLLRDGDPRWATPPREDIATTTPEGFKALWAPLLASGPIEVEVFGDINIDRAIDAVAKSFGALPTRAVTAMTPPPVRFPAHVATPVVRTHQGASDRAIAVIAWPTGGGVAGITESRRLDILANIFSDRLFDRLRSEAGASYSPNVSNDWPIGASSGGRMLAIGQVAPENLPLFFKLAREIAADLVAHPISDDELNRTVGPMTQLILRQATGNQFWMNRLAGATYDPSRIDALRNIYQDVASTTAADLQAAAARYLKPENDWTLQVVPKPR